MRFLKNNHLLFLAFALMLCVSQIVILNYFSTKCPYRADNSNECKNECSASYINIEQLRRSIFDDVEDLKLMVLDKFKEIESAVKNSEYVASFRDDFYNRTDLILSKLISMSMDSGLNKWKERETKRLEEQIGHELDVIQNPKDCSSAKKIYCKIRVFCGFGCQISDLVYCLQTAYATKRTLIVDSRNWTYDKNGFGDYFKPMTHCKPGDISHLDYTYENPVKLTTEKELLIPDIVKISMKQFRHLPWNIPKSISKQLRNVHGHASSWWLGQLTAYLLRFSDKFQHVYSQYEKEIYHGNKPIVGIHIRRTDKIGTEAFGYSIEQYMIHVLEYFRIRDLSNASKIGHKTVYLATDDPFAIEEAIKQYPDITFKYNRYGMKSAWPENRYSPKSLKNLLFDIHILSRCEYVVGTLSSTLGRIVFQLMQNIHTVDASWRFKSLDSEFHYTAGWLHNKIAILDHFPNASNNKPKNVDDDSLQEIEIRVGDVINCYTQDGRILVNLWNGFTLGTNLRTGKDGIFPTYKVKSLIEEF